MESEVPVDEQSAVGDWGLDEYEELYAPLWRKPLLIGVALLTVAAMASGPIYNLVNDGAVPVADNGLEVCGFDYCVVQDAIREAGLDLVMSRFANIHLDDESAVALADVLLDHVGVEPVTVTVVDRLDGHVEGEYSPASRTILIERPARAWTVLHEVAHVDNPGHGAEFQRGLIDLALWLDGAFIG